MILIKLGGSVITDKTKYRAFRAITVSRLCAEIKESGKDVLIVHGAGSFGHVLAKKYEINDGYKNEKQIPAVAKICYDTRDLSQKIVNELNKKGLPSVSVPTGSAFVMKNRKLILKDGKILKNFVEMGIIPVTFGDVITDEKLGFAICSGDQIMEKLTEIFDIERIIFVSDVDGLYDKNPKTHKDAKLIEKVNEKILAGTDTKSKTADVTGGVSEKMKIMLRLCDKNRDCILVNGNEKGRLLALLNGEEVICTKAAVKK